jgi:hypothetical protein
MHVRSVLLLHTDGCASDSARFFYYFLQDCFPNGYVVFGYTITKSTQSMVRMR